MSNREYKEALIPQSAGLTDQVNGIMLHVDEYVRREYLSVLEKAEPLPLEASIAGITPGSNMQVMHLESFTYNKEENIAQKIRGVYGALERSGVSVALILDGRADRADLYLGVFTERPEDTSSGYKAFLTSFNGVFPGCRYRNVKAADSRRILKEILEPPVDVSVAAVSAFSMLQKEDGRTLLAGLDVLLDGMKNRPFAMVFLAKALERSELVRMRQGFEALYTQISPFQKQDISVSCSQTDTYGVNFSQSVAKSLSVSTGVTQGHTHTVGTSHSTQKSPDLESQKKFQAVSKLAGTASVLLFGPAAAAEASVFQNLFYGSALSNVFESAATVLGIAPEQEREVTTQGSHEDESDSYSETKNLTKGATDTESKGASLSQGKTSGQTAQISCTNKSVADLLERLEAQIQEMTELENSGAFRAAAYFIAGDPQAASAAASLYRSIVTSERGTAMNSPVYCWKEREQVDLIAKSLMRGTHPVFTFQEYPDYPCICAAQPIGLQDLPAYLCLPQKSLSGITVTDHAAFARNILYRNNSGSESSQRIEIGCIHHMGKDVTSTPVTLDMNALASHLFVAGTTGLGKSNFCYQLLDQLIGKGVKALVIEPAKGEYVKVFGGRKDFKVYGTNLRQAPPLRINPFAFPKGISAPEHIERLMAIFEAAWPMYSAMPAIMKEALEEIYRKQGFDDIWGELPENGRFPTFSDLLDTLPEIIQSSKYSQEVQGNYIGALVTRVKSLTNGVYTILFSEDELTDEELFDQNVIIDISRIGSEETKSLIMGMLITRLTEYRICSGRMNSALRHVTLLEEAHHLLGRQPSGHSQDMGNMRGASVEMIGNAIREMRTYGDGFIIADQSPTVMDASVISNTQTKVFFMMPDGKDRAIAADAASLTEKQTMEIAKLPCGVALVWQNEWTDAVLCKIKYFAPSSYQGFSYDFDMKASSHALLQSAVKILAAMRMGKERMEEGISLTPEECRLAGYALGNRRNAVFEVLKHRDGAGRLLPFDGGQIPLYMDELLGFDRMMAASRKENSIEAWAKSMNRQIKNLADMADDEMEAAISMLLHMCAAKDRKTYHKLYVDYLAFINDR